MKFKVTMKSADALDYAVADAIERESGTLSSEEIDDWGREKVRELARYCESKWFQWGELLTVEIDTEAGTCTVVPLKED